jgi:hypothetical protein
VLLSWAKDVLTDEQMDSINQRASATLTQSTVMCGTYTEFLCPGKIGIYGYLAYVSGLTAGECLVRFGYERAGVREEHMAD